MPYFDAKCIQSEHEYRHYPKIHKDQGSLNPRDNFGRLQGLSYADSNDTDSEI